MRIYLVDGRAFIEIVPDYLLYICQEKDLESATLEQVQAMVDRAIAHKNPNVLAYIESSKTVH